MPNLVDSLKLDESTAVASPAISRYLGLSVAFTGLIVLLGWAFHIDWLKSMLPGLTTMKANTAVALAAGGLSVFLVTSSSPAARFLALLLTALTGCIGGLSLLQYALGVSFGIDEIVFFDSDTAPANFPGRMSLASAAGFLLIALSIGTLSVARASRSIGIAHFLAALTGTIGLLGLVGYAYGLDAALYGFSPFATLALHTATGLLLLCAAALLIRPDEGWRRPFARHPIARSALVRVGFISILIPVVAGFLSAAGIRWGLYKAPLAPAVLAVATACALLMLAFRSARILARAEDDLELSREEARLSGAQLALALSSGRGIGTWDWDVINDRVFADERFATLYGVEPLLAKQGAPMQRIFQGVHAEDLPRLRTNISAALRTGAALSEEYRLVRAGRASQWVIAEGRCELAEDGSPVRFRGVSFDITDRKIVEAHQRTLLHLSDRIRELSDPAEIAYEASRLLGEALEVSRVGYGVVNKEDETISIEREWNARGVASLAGVLQFRNYGSYIEDLKRGETVVFADARLDPRTREAATALEAINARSAVNMPLFERSGFVALLYANHSAARAWSEADLLLMRQVADRVRLASERMRAEAAVRESENQFRAFAEAVPNHIWASRPNGYLDWFNQQAYAYSGATTGTLDGIDEWAQLVHPDDAPVAGAAWACALALGTVYETEFRIRRADNTYRWFLVRAVPVRSSDGEILRWVGTNTDIDERRRQSAALAALNLDLESEVKKRTDALMRTEEQLRQSQKMEAVGQLTGGLAHDFNNLLTGISGSLELLRTRVAQGRVNDLDRYVLVAQGAARRAAALTHRLLAFSRRQTLDPKPTDTNRLIAGMEELIRRTIGPVVRLEVVTAGALWHTLVDPNQLENALLNLCINARDAMPTGGRLTVETANKWLDERAAEIRDLSPGQYVSICVSDTGTGMTPDVIERAFDPFFTTKPLGEGTGLGLSMVYGFVRQSGGQVRIYSEAGHGAMVCLYLPRYLGDAESPWIAPAAAPHVRAASGKTVLVVDDEPSVRMLVTEVLEDLGIAAIEAADAMAGLKILESNVHIDLLISDVGLPGGMNGRQMVDAARLMRSDLTVLFITGYAENAVIGNGHLEHGMHVMTKPFAIDALAHRIRDLTAS